MTEYGEKNMLFKLDAIIILLLIIALMIGIHWYLILT